MNGQPISFPAAPPPSFRPTDLALSLFPGRSLGKPQSSTNPETPMPLAPTTRSRSKKFSLAPAAALPAQPAPLFFPDLAPAVSEIGDHRFPHAPAILLFVLVKRKPAWDPVSGWVQSHCRGAQKTLRPSVLVRRVVSASVFRAWVVAKPCYPARVSETLAPAQRAKGHWWAWRQVGGLGRTCWARMAGQLTEGRQIVLVKSFSSACSAPLPVSGNRCAGFALNEWGGFHA